MSCIPWPSEEKFLERVLRDCEDELAFSLCRVDPVELCENFFERSVISRESYNHFTSMDHSRIKSRLRLRYLVRLVSDKIKKDPALWENLIAVLDTLEGVPSSLTDKLKQARLNEKEGLADDSEAVGGVSGASLGEASENEDVVLTTRDVNFLTELLTEVRDKWYEIAISLGLPQHEITDCEGKNNKISLFQILGFWIANNSVPTLKKLTDTLCSEIVARTAAAEKITRKFMEAKRISKGNSSPKSTITPTTPRTVSQSLPTEVADGKSTLLQVQASPRETVSYRWKKDGQPLANSSRYSGVDEDILVVRHASQGTEGEYTCQVSLQDKQVSSEPITLTVCFSLAKKHLLNLYVFDIPAQKDSWPLVVANTFINLVLIIPKSRLPYRSRGLPGISPDYSVCGDADDVIAMKEKITYKDAFSDYKSGELILVEGRPGSGKTTLAHKVVKDWKLGEVLTKSELTFLITLRLLNNNRRDENLASILREFYSDDGELNKIVSTILEKDGKGVCFVLDGLDEYCSQNKEKSVILKLLDRKLLPQSMIIVFSRPSVIELLNKYHIKKRIEVFGFSKEQISQYIDNFPFEENDGSSDNSKTRASQLKKYLHSRPNIHDMCYLPIHTAMICFLLHVSDNLSPTHTSIYKEFTRSIVYRHLARHESCLALDSLNKLSVKHARYFENLCHLAYEMTTKSEQVISSQKLDDWLGGRGSLSEEAGLGLLIICPTLQKTGIHQNYAFLHLTFQEFLAAYYIANYLDESQQIQLLRGRSRYHMRTVWRFYSGLVDFENSEQKLHSLLGSIQDRVDCEFFYYARESQQKCVCNAVMTFYSQKLTFRGTLRVSDITPIEYVVTTSSQLITDLEIVNMDYNTTAGLLHKLKKADLSQLQCISILTNNSFGFLLDACLNDDGMEHFCELLKKSINIKNLYLKVEHTLLSSAGALADQINLCTKLLNLRLTYSGTPECIQTFAVALNPHVPECCLSLEMLDHHGHEYGYSERNRWHGCLCLKVFNNDIREDHLPCLLGSQNKTPQNIFSLNLSLMNFEYSELACLSNCYTRLQDVDQSDDNVDLDGASTLAGGLKFLTALKCPDRSDKNIGPDCTIVDDCGQKFFSSLQCLDLSASNIEFDGISGAKALAGGYKYMVRLEELNLRTNKICPDVATVLACGIEFLTALRKLDLSENNIGPEGATALAGKFKFLPALQKLDLSQNNIGPDCAIALVQGFKFLTSLHMLDLSDNNIGSDGAIALADGLCCLTELRQCILCDNSITLPGAKAVITSLKECEHLKQLVIESQPFTGCLIGGSPSNADCCCIVMHVHPNSTTVVSELKKVAQHNFKQVKLDLGFKIIMITPKYSSSENCRFL